MSTYDKALNKEYESKLPYPSKPAKPEVLRKKAGDLSADEIASLATVVADHEVALDLYHEQMRAYQEDARKLEEKFEHDLAEEYGMLDHPKRHKLYAMAEQHGHSAGRTEVCSYYGEFVELAR